MNLGWHVVQVNEWLSLCNTQLRPLVDDKLAKVMPACSIYVFRVPLMSGYAMRPVSLGACRLQVNDKLLARVYLVGSGLTLADLVLFSTVHPAVVS
jgi:glutathione S-transferase